MSIIFLQTASFEKSLELIYTTLNLVVYDTSHHPEGQ